MFEQDFAELLADVSWQLAMQYDIPGMLHREPVFPPPRSAAAKQERPAQSKERLLPALIEEPTTNPWVECMGHFLIHVYHKSSSEGTVLTYKCSLTRFFRSIPGKDPARVTATDIENFLSQPVTSGKRRGQPMSANTRNSLIGHISSFYTFAAWFIPSGGEEPLFPPQKPNPTKGVYRSQPMLNYRALDEKEIAAFFAAIPQATLQGKRDKALFLCYLFTSRRLAEIARLTWEDIQPGILTDKRGAQHEGLIMRYRQKGRGGQWETAELPRPCYDAIVDYLRAAGRLETMGKASPLFLPIGPQGRGRRPQSGEALNTSTIRHTMKLYCRAAGLDERLSTHSWRHTSVQLRLRNGDELLDIMKVTGHKSLDAFYRYTRGLQSSADEGAAKLEKRLSFLTKK